MSAGIILIHGYTGSSAGLEPLAKELSSRFGEDSVRNISLPGHSSGAIPEFDGELFTGSIVDSIKSYRNENRKIIIIGHSTGGSLAIAALDQCRIAPDLLVLISVPKKIDLKYLERWNSHRSGKAAVSLADVSLMVKFINSAGAMKPNQKFPVLLIHGEDDKLVPSSESFTWKDENFTGSARVVTIPKVSHDVFSGKNSGVIIDLVSRAISDQLNKSGLYQETLDSLVAVESEFKDFIRSNPESMYHLSVCPGAQRVIGRKPELQAGAPNDPVIANIEITTYCNLNCRFCARAQLKKKNKHMSIEQFRDILAILPNTYRIVLVGLGEPLIHPRILDFIRYAKSSGRKVGFVTNAMLLSPETSHKLLETGLDSITFSIDGFDEHSSAQARAGTDFNKVIANIKEFVRITNSTRKITKAVFSAVSITSAPHLKKLIDLISELGMDVLMLSDINFKANLKDTLWQNANEELEKTIRSAVSHAFSKKLPVLSVHGLEEFGLEKRYHDFLLIPPAQLCRRSRTHTWCLSPWQTIPVDVDGNVTLCDCQPDLVLGNLLNDPFQKIWNGAVMKKYRMEMLSGNPPEACRICPRF